MRADHALGVFLRFPEKGKVKTRLAATMGEEKALAVYTFLLEHTLFVASAVQAPVTLFYEGGLPAERERHPAFEYHVQVKGTLSEKLIHAFSVLLTKAEKAVVMGSDCPEISTRILEESFSLLDTHDVVLGPASDGGFYLLGGKQIDAHLFENIQWSTSSVLTQITRNIFDVGFSCKQLETLSDIDTEKDWEAFRNKRANE